MHNVQEIVAGVLAFRQELVGPPAASPRSRPDGDGKGGELNGYWSAMHVCRKYCVGA